MPVQFACPKCKKSLQAKAGTKVACPGCKTTLQVPAPRTMPSATQSVPPPFTGKPPVASQPAVKASTIQFTCPKCKKGLTAPREKAGARTSCPSCKTPLQVPKKKTTDLHMPTVEKPPVHTQPVGSQTAQNGPTIHFNCPKCQRSLSAPGERAGAKTKCPSCQTPLQVPNKRTTDVDVSGPKKQLPHATNHRTRPNPSEGKGPRLRRIWVLVGAGTACFAAGIIVAVLLFQNSGSGDKSGSSSNQIAEGPKNTPQQPEKKSPKDEPEVPPAKKDKAADQPEDKKPMTKPPTDQKITTPDDVAKKDAPKVEVPDKEVPKDDAPKVELTKKEGPKKQPKATPPSDMVPTTEAETLVKVGEVTYQNRMIEIFAQESFLSRVRVEDFVLTAVSVKSKTKKEVPISNLKCMATLQAEDASDLRYLSMDKDGITVGTSRSFPKLAKGQKSPVILSLPTLIELGRVHSIRFVVDRDVVAKAPQPKDKVADKKETPTNLPKDKVAEKKKETPADQPKDQIAAKKDSPKDDPTTAKKEQPQGKPSVTVAKPVEFDSSGMITRINDESLQKELDIYKFLSFHSTTTRPDVGRVHSHTNAGKRILIRPGDGVILLENLNDSSWSYWSAGKWNRADSLLNAVQTFHALAAQAQLKQKEVNGPQKIFYANGKLRSESTFLNGKLHGVAKDFYDTGALMVERNYVNGVQNGAEKMFYANGKPKSEVTFANGKKVGWEKGWLDDGSKAFEGLYDNGGLAQGTHTSWSSKDTKLSEGSFKDGKKLGPWIEWGLDGKKKHIELYLDGLKHGGEVSFFLGSETVSYTCQWENGRKHGVERYYRPDSSVMEEHTYVNGVQQD